MDAYEIHRRAIEAEWDGQYAFAAALYRSVARELLDRAAAVESTRAALESAAVNAESTELLAEPDLLTGTDHG